MVLIDINGVSLVSTALGGFIMFYGFVSLFVKERLYLSEATVSVAIGIILGPVALKIFVPQDWGNQEEINKLTLEFTRIVIAIQVMEAGVSLPKAYLWTELKSLLALLLPGMIWMWASTGLFIWLLIGKLSFLEALAIAACVTPTDPVLANSIVKGRFAEKHVPPHVRNILSAESAANDGLGVPFLYVSIYLMTESTGTAFAKWFYLVWGYQILLSCVIGLVVGYVARKALRLAETRKLIDKQSFLAFAISLALFLMGIVSILGCDELLACFFAGNSITWDDWFRKETEEAHFQEVIEMLLNISVFVYIGASIPWSSFGDAALELSMWRLVLLAVALLLLRRLPIVLALYRVIPAIETYREAIFTGWFGPIGVGAIFVSSAAQDVIDKDGPHAYARRVLLPIVYFCVFSSVLVHGCTIPIFKIGQRINTRQLTITDSLNQVSRLPIVRFGQDIRFRQPKPTQAEEEQEGSKTPSLPDTSSNVTTDEVEVIDIESGERTVV